MNSHALMAVLPVRSSAGLGSCQAVPPAVALGGDCEPPKFSELAEKILMIQTRLSESHYTSPQSSHHHTWGEPSKPASGDAAVGEESLLPAAADERMLHLQCEALARRNGELSDKVAELVGVIQNLQLVREPERALGSEVHISTSAAIRPNDRVPIGKATGQDEEVTKEMLAFETDRMRLDVTLTEDYQGTTVKNNQDVGVGSSNSAVVALFDALAERQCEQEAALQAMALEQAWFEGRMALMSEERGVILRLVRTYWVGAQGPGVTEFAQPRQRERTSDASGSSPRRLISSSSNSDPPRGDSLVRVVRLKRNPMDLCR